MPTRVRIIDYLRKQQTASVLELGLALSKTAANIRHHLGILESDDIIEVIGRRQGPRGRPVNIYSLSHRLLGDGVGGLAGVMLHVMLADTDKVIQEGRLRSIASRLGGSITLEPHLTLTHRMNRLVEQLNELHYLSHWEAGERGPDIILGNCPYASIIATHPELCQMDLFLLEDWTSLAMEQTAKLKSSSKGFHYCVFRIR